MTELRPQPPLDEEPRPRTPAQKSVLAAASAALALWAGLWFGVVGTFGLMIAVGPVALIVPFAAVIALVVVHVVIAARVTGRRHVLSSTVVVLASAAFAGAWLVSAGTIPIWWVAPGFDAAFPVVALTGGVLFGLLTGPPSLRRVGVGVLVVVAIAIATPFVAVQVQSIADAAARAEEEARADEQRRLEAFEDFIANGPHPMTVDLAGAEVISMDRWPALTYVLVDGEGVVEVDVDAWNELSNPLTRCAFIAAPGKPYELTGTLEDFDAWCTVSGDDAVLVDGTGISQIREDRLVLVHTVEHAAKLDPNARPATADEVQAVFEALRPMTEAELRAAFSPDD